MRNIRIRQLLPLNREKGVSTAIKCQQTYEYTSRSADSTNAMTAHGLTYSPSTSGTEIATFSRPAMETPTATSPLLANKEPILLLEGDNYRFSANGIARSLYQLVSERSKKCGTDVASSCLGSTTNLLAIEEIYDIGRARKGFVIRETTKRITGVNASTNRERHVQFDDASHPISLLLQEISHEGEQNGAGTGSRTWESSIAMSAYFASHPELMFGNVIEIGSGVGLGGILSFLFRSLSSSTAPFHSMTLSDFKLQVLDHCNDNVRSFLKSYPSFSSISVAELDWYDILKRRKGSSEHAEKYDTVIACDCAYDYTDIGALVGTLKGLLRKKKTSKAHIFGPTSRGGLHTLLSELRKEQCFIVHVECIEMTRYRLDPPRTNDSLRSLDDFQKILLSSSLSLFDENDNPEFHSKFDSEFLHVTCSLCLDSDIASRKDAPLLDID